MNLKLKKYLEQKTALINVYLDKYLPKGNEGIIAKAMRYSIFAGGKRLRPILTLATAKAFGVKELLVIPVACAIEMIHTYSLIHDDLPAMDNDDWRRGKPTNHKKFGEDIAILAGDALMTLAYQTIVDKANYKELKPSIILRIISEIGKATSLKGMVGGQVDDLKNEGKIPTEDKLKKIHQKKTGALIVTSVKTGAMASGKNGIHLEKCEEFARHFGLAFQITDDILDVTQDKKTLGKTPKKDIKKKKVTYPSFYGIEKSRKLAAEEIEKAKKCLSVFNKRADELRWLAEYIIERKN